MKFPQASWSIALLAACLSSLPAPCAELDAETLAKHIRKSVTVPPGVEFKVRDIRPSRIAGFKTATLETTYKTKTQTQNIHITNDRKFYFLTDARAIGPSPIKGFLANVPDEDSFPNVYISKDLKHLFLGEAYDLTRDPDAERMKKIQLSNTPSRGPAQAAVVLVEYSDLQCPYCSSAHQALEKNLAPTYGDKIRWVFKHFPLTSIHPWAYPAAIASACAQMQNPDAAWKFYAHFFETGKDITKENLREKALGYAGKDGLDIPKFTACLDGQESKAIVEGDMAEAASLKVNSTPTFIVNGRLISGFRDFENFKTHLDEIMKEASAKK